MTERLESQFKLSTLYLFNSWLSILLTKAESNMRPDIGIASWLKMLKSHFASSKTINLSTCSIRQTNLLIPYTIMSERWSKRYSDQTMINFVPNIKIQKRYFVTLTSSHLRNRLEKPFVGKMLSGKEFQKSFQMHNSLHKPFSLRIFCKAN